MEKKRESAVTLNIKGTPKKQPRTEEELAPEDGALYDSDFQPFIDLSSLRESIQVHLSKLKRL